MTNITKEYESNNESKRAIRLVKLYELLKEETNIDNPLSTNELLLRLKKIGCPCVRQTLKTDIDCLINGGFNIKEKNVGHSNGYYFDDQLFTTAELRLLIDAVHASGFVPEDKATLLTEKIIQLNGSHTKKFLENSLVQFNTRRHTNESVWLNIEAVSRAIALKRQVKFYYFLLNENHEKKYKHNKKRYNVNPLATVYNDDYYYLVAWDKEKNDIANYRIDRMEMVEVSRTAISTQAQTASEHITTYINEVFKMYGGPEETITLQFDEELMKVIFDKFGESTEITRLHNKSGKITKMCTATVQVQVSPTFWGWLFQFGKQMKIISPQHMIDSFQDHLKELLL